MSLSVFSIACSTKILALLRQYPQFFCFSWHPLRICYAVLLSSQEDEVPLFPEATDVHIWQHINKKDSTRQCRTQFSGGHREIYVPCA